MIFSPVNRTSDCDAYFELHLPYTLAQKVFPLLKYGGWTDLEKHELQAKAGPYKDAIKEHWNRIKESRECMDSLGRSLQKEKWDDVLCFVAQDQGPLLRLATSWGCAHSEQRAQLDSSQQHDDDP